jgi:uncharacterized membrane protein
VALAYGAWFLTGVVYKITLLFGRGASKAPLEFAADLVLAILALLAGSLLLARKRAGQVLAVVTSVLGLLTLVADYFLSLHIGSVPRFLIHFLSPFFPIALLVLALLPPTSRWLGQRTQSQPINYDYPQQYGIRQPQQRSPQAPGYPPQYQGYPPPQGLPPQGLPPQAQRPPGQ